MSGYSQNRVDQVDVARALRRGALRATTLERFVGPWHYVTPVAPATGPANYNPADPLGQQPFQNGLGNLAGQQPARFRIQPATVVEIEWGVSGVVLASLPVIGFTLPGPGLGFWPPNPHPCEFTSTDGLALWSGLVDMSGNVWVTAQLVAPA